MLMGMNCDDEKMGVISSSSTTCNWPQTNNNNNINHMISNDHHHHKKSLTINSANKNMASSTMDQKPAQDHHHQNNALKCPRCDSSNTKFCYYNNYSLSQPRHFCKACRRYWTRGGTLRNVPVGGGCRKNKRLKRPGNSSAAGNSSSSPNLGAAINSQQPQIHLLSGGHHSHISSLFYNHQDVSLPFSRYDHLVQPQLSSLGLGFSSDNHNNGGENTANRDTNHQNGLISSNSLLSSYSSIFGNTTSSSSPTIASLLVSKFANGGLKDQESNFQALAPFEELNIAGLSSAHEAGLMSVNKQAKLEFDGQGRSALDWINGTDHQNQTDQIGLSSTISSDPSLFWANQTAFGGVNWHDPAAANIGSNSVPSLI